MKNKVIKLILILLSAGLFGASMAFITTVAVTGCSTLNPGTNSQANLDAAAILLRDAARNGAILAIQKDPNNAKWFQLASSTVGTFLTGKQLSPAAFQSALLALNSPTLTNVWVQIGTGTVIDLYELYYGQFVVNQVNSNAAAAKLLTAVEEGFSVGAPAKLTAVASKPVAILPRPLKKR